MSEPTDTTASIQPDDATASDVADTAAPEAETVDGEICGQCWPAGWPENGDAAHCSHGEWQR